MSYKRKNEAGCCAALTPSDRILCAGAISSSRFTVDGPSTNLRNLGISRDEKSGLRFRSISIIQSIKNLSPSPFYILRDNVLPLLWVCLYVLRIFFSSSSDIFTPFSHVFCLFFACCYLFFGYIFILLRVCIPVLRLCQCVLRMFL